MATATAKTTKTIVLELSSDEADVLATVLAHVSSESYNKSPAVHTDAIYTALDYAGVDYFKSPVRQLVTSPAYGGIGIEFKNYPTEGGK
jgi:hypothetical protein